MSFEALPDNCILQIINHLPFKDRVRVGGVNRLFNKLSKESIDQTRSLDLTTDLHKYCLRSYPFWQLLESCSPNLLRLNSTSPCSIDMLEILPEFLYPKLDHLEIDVAHTNKANEANRVKKSFFNLLKRNPTIRSIKLQLAYAFDFPTDVIFDRLECLEIHGDIDNKEVMKAIYNRTPAFIPFGKLFESLTGRIPNLNRLVIQILKEDGKLPVGQLDHLAESINKLIGTLPNLTSLHLCVDECDLIDDYQKLWTRSSLVELRLDVVEPEECSLVSHKQDVLNKIATSFPQLQVFFSKSIDNNNHDDYDFDDDDNYNYSNNNGDGEDDDNDSNDDDDSSMLLVLKKLKHLRKLHVPELFMDESIFVEILASFTSLDHLEIKGIGGISKAESFIDVLKKIPDMGKSITVQFNDDMFRSIWYTDCVKAALESMKENGGPIIEIKGSQNHSNQ